MEQKPRHLLALALILSGALFLSSCSSSSVQEDGAELSSDELPMVDADTDMMPNSLEQSGDAVADSAGDLSPEASTEVPGTSETNALSDAVAASEATPESETGPSTEAPPSMNETAPPVADNFSNDSYNSAGSGSSGGGSHLYEIQKGDTLMKIAYRCYGDLYQWKKVLEDNQDRIPNPNSLVAGTQLKVDQPAQDEDFGGFERYLIQNGDTLGSISDGVYGTTAKWKHLWKLNDRLIKDPNRIYAGFFLKYSMSPDEQQEAERFKQMKQAPAPLAGSVPASDRGPSSQEASASGAVPAQTHQN